VPAQRFNTLEDLLADEHLQQVGFFETAAHPSEGEIVQMRPAARWSGADLSMRRLPPAVGQDSVAVLGELGYSAAQIEAMLASGAAKGV
jgi:crotonobetainyl-CoA:carnitine CoA-transferase CaiB-like acyl-CoA transferase